LIKVNQNWNLAETIAAVNMAKITVILRLCLTDQVKRKIIQLLSLAVALNCGQIKTGSASRSDRMAEIYVRIEEELGDTAFFPGKKALKLNK
jgi:enolase